MIDIYVYSSLVVSATAFLSCFINELKVKKVKEDLKDLKIEVIYLKNKLLNKNTKTNSS